jgi:1-acyl-sn-glycerol-3-phosphate acyltransferase
VKRLQGAFEFVFFWTVVWGATIGFTLWNCLLIPALRMTGKADISSDVHRVATLWARSIMTSIPGWKINIEGRENLSNQPCVIVANHESATDILAMYYLGIQFRWLAKKEVFRVPFMGTSMKWAGYVPIDRKDRDSHRKALEISADWVKKGIPMFFFPEGTRSTTGVIGTFKVGAFKLAHDCGVAVLPICIKGAGGLLAKGGLVPKRATVSVKVLPLEAQQPNESIDEFSQRIRNLIAEHHSHLS